MLKKDDLDDGAIYLRCLVPEEIGQTYLQWIRDKDINQFLEVRHNLPSTVSELQQFVASINDSSDSIMFGIFVGDHKHIGNIKLGPVDSINMRAEIGVLLGDKSEWGKGYATRAIQLVSKYAFECLGLVRLTAGMHEPNQGSFRVFIKAGFVHEGTSKSYWQAESGRLNQLWLGLTNE